MASSDSQIDKPQQWNPKRAGLPDVNVNTGHTPGPLKALIQSEGNLRPIQVKI